MRKRHQRESCEGLACCPRARGPGEQLLGEWLTTTFASFPVLEPHLLQSRESSCGLTARNASVSCCVLEANSGQALPHCVRASLKIKFPGLPGKGVARKPTELRVSVRARQMIGARQLTTRRHLVLVSRPTSAEERHGAHQPEC